MIVSYDTITCQKESHHRVSAFKGVSTPPINVKKYFACPTAAHHVAIGAFIFDAKCS